MSRAREKALSGSDGNGPWISAAALFDDTKEEREKGREQEGTNVHTANNSE